MIAIRWTAYLLALAAAMLLTPISFNAQTQPLAITHVNVVDVASGRIDMYGQSTFAMMGGGVALTLAALGVYGVVGFIVAMRTREMAVRMALGATSRRVLRTILTDVVMLVAPGVAFGLIVAVAYVRMSFLSFYSLGGVEPLVYTAGAAIAVCVALLTGLPSARRAASVEPMMAIRSE